MLVPCDNCGDFILTGKYARTDESYYHPSCFNCSVCGCSVLQEYYEYQHKLFCKADFQASCCPNCDACGGKISGKFISALEKKFHQECFSCSICKKQLKSHYFYMGDDLLCEAHSQFSPVSPKCGLEKSLTPAGPSPAALFSARRLSECVSPSMHNKLIMDLHNKIQSNSTTPRTDSPSTKPQQEIPSPSQPPKLNHVALRNLHLELVSSSNSGASSSGATSRSSSFRSNSSVPLNERRAFKEIGVDLCAQSPRPQVTTGSAKRKVGEAFAGLSLTTPSASTPKSAKVHVQCTPLEHALTNRDEDHKVDSKTNGSDGSKQVELVATCIQDHTIVRAGSLDALIDRLTRVSDTEFFSTFLLTYRSFMSPQELLQRLIRCFKNSSSEKHVLLRVLNVCRSWVDNHFDQDFLGNSRLLSALQDFMRAVHESGHRDQANIALVIEKKILEQRIVHEKSTSLNPTTSHSRSPLSSTLVGFRSKPPKALLSRRVKNGKGFTFVDIHPLEIARQMTLIESSYFNAIRPMECLNQAWNKKDKDKHAPNMSALIARFNATSYAFATLICGEPVLSKRIQIVKHLIKVAEHLQTLNNYNGIMEVVTGMQMAPVYRLEKTWKGISKKRKATLEKLTKLLSSHASFKDLRMALKTCNPPCVPYLGMYLTDLTFIEDGNPNKTSDGLINFQKRSLLAKVIREIQLYQQPYNLESVPALKDYILDLKVLDPNSLYDQSLEIEPREGGSRPDRLPKRPEDEDSDCILDSSCCNNMSDDDEDDDEDMSDIDDDQLSMYEKRRSTQMTVEDILALENPLMFENPASSGSGRSSLSGQSSVLSDAGSLYVNMNKDGHGRIDRFIQMYKTTF